MNCKELKNEVLDCIINTNAWDEISRNYGLNEEMLEKYADKLNWNNVSQNSGIRWTVRLIEKWADRLDWEALSDSSNEYLLTPDVIAYFVNRWNWHKLSGNYNLNLDYLFIDRFIDRWDWEELIDRGYRGEDIYGREFFERYRSHIPMHAFLGNSSLLQKMQEQEAERIKRELTGGC
ncbi:MAG: hypothetical protein IJU90_01580 [Bacteroidales bacterium]|nr:hypothetical protein [Bacteroidales bacterium]